MLDNEKPEASSFELNKNTTNESLQILRYKYLSLQDDLDLLVGQDLSLRLLKSMPIDIKDWSEDDLRAHYDTAKNQISRYMELRVNFGKIRTKITAMATILAASFFGLIIYYFFDEARTPTGGSRLFALSLILLCGMLGGCVSALARLYSLRWNETFFIEANNPVRLFSDLLLNFAQSIVIGAVFSIILYLAFVGNFISGQLFPSFRLESTLDYNSGDWNFFHYYLEHGPASHSDYAKALLWAFAAGFSERLVPDFISTLIPNIITPPRKRVE